MAAKLPVPSGRSLCLERQFPWPSRTGRMALKSRTGGSNPPGIFTRGQIYSFLQSVLSREQPESLRGQVVLLMRNTQEGVFGIAQSDQQQLFYSKLLNPSLRQLTTFFKVLSRTLGLSSHSHMIKIFHPISRSS